MKKIIISHPTGNANVRGAADGFYRKGILHSFHTTVACFKGDILYRLSALPFLREFRRREFSRFLRGNTKTYPIKELGRMIARKLKQSKWTKHETGRFCVDQVYRTLDKRVANYTLIHRKDIAAVYCYEDCALETFKTAKSLGKVCLYDLPTGHWRSLRKLLSEEAAKNQLWQQTLRDFSLDSNDKFARKDEELKLADLIFVASNFTKQSLINDCSVQIKQENIIIIPYGYPPVVEKRKYNSANGRKLKFLFVGRLTYNKGISYLFEALKGLEQKIELTIVGSGNAKSLNVLNDNLKQTTYIPYLLHPNLISLMGTQDVLLFPSLFEGFGLVITEAMSQGTPVITTDRTCGPDIITHNKDGWVIEAGSTVALRKQIEKLINHPEQIAKVGKSAMQTAQKRPWSKYEEELADSVTNYLQTR